MMSLVRIVAFLHLGVYVGIMYYGWQSYKLLRKKSWRYMGIGFVIFLLYRIRQFIEQMIADHPIDNERLVPFIGALFLLVGFRMLSREHNEFINTVTNPSPMRSGAQPVEFWLDKIRTIVREEIDRPKMVQKSDAEPH